MDGRVGARQEVQPRRRGLRRQTGVPQPQRLAHGPVQRETDDDLTPDDGTVHVMRPEVFGEVQGALLVSVAHQAQLMGETRLQAGRCRLGNVQ